MTQKETYRQLCESRAHSEIPVFLLPCWLDTIAENWDVVFYKEDNKILAAMPYCWKGILLTKRIYLPDLSFYQSPVIFESEDIDTSKKQFIVQKLFTQLPLTILSYFKLTPDLYSLDLSGEGYAKENYSTYIIKGNQPLKPLSQHHQRYVQKGITQGYTISESQNLEKSFAMIKSTFDRQHAALKVNQHDFQNLIKCVQDEQKGKVIDCLDNSHNLLGSIFLVTDTKTSYYLMSGYNDSFKNSGAIAFLLYHHIKECAEKKIDFNFCGSSIKTIANFFEGFGAEKTPIAIWKKKLI